MKRTLCRLLGPFLLAAAAVLIASGCGGGDGTTTAEESTAEGGSAGKALVVNMGDYYFDPVNASANPGATTIEAVNVGKVEHELVLFRTDMNPADLPTGPDGTVEEEKMDKLAEAAGEVPDVEAGDAKSAQFDLKPGKYVMFCNLPGHYAQGMYGSLTVSK
ncbi:MAG: plastocyanin/azurin family copper-binding protein [Solirubrobacterales bacterium]